MDIELFGVSRSSFDSADDFRTYLEDVYVTKKSDWHLSLVTGLTRRTEQDTVQVLENHGFEVAEELGAVRRLTIPWKEDEFGAYVTYESPGVLCFFTNFRKTKEIPLLVKFLEEDPRSHPLVVRPPHLIATIRALEREYTDLQIRSFVARRQEDTRIPAQARPDLDEQRTITYYGPDGADALRELQHQYGVEPHKITIEGPRVGKFKLDHNGILTYHKGSRAVFFKLWSEILDDSIGTLEAFTSSEYTVLPISTQEKEFEVPSSSPIRIELKKRLKFSEIGSLRDYLEDEGYVLLDWLAEEGSLFVSAEMYDNSGQKYKLKANEDRIKLLPKGDVEYQTFMNFYQFIIDRIDSRATVDVIQ